MTEYTPTQRRLVLVAAIAASSMGFIDGSVISIITPAIRSTLNASLSDAQWVSNAYLLTLSALLLLGGAAGDRFGLRNVFAVGIAVFVGASLIAAIAPSPTLLIVARTIQGIGGAFMVPASLAMIAEAYPSDKRGSAIGIWAAASSLTSLAGPVLGGLLISVAGETGWRLVFALNLPLGGIALAILLSMPVVRAAAARPLDLVGAALATLFLLLVSWALTDIGNPLFLVQLGAGIVAGLAFLFWERRAPYPMLPLKLFRDPRFTGAQGVTFLIYFALSAVSFYLPMVMIAGWRVTPVDVALAMLPIGIALTLLSPPAGHLADRIGPGAVIAAGAQVVTLAFVALGALTPLHQTWLVVLPAMAVFGIGMSGIAGPISTAVMLAAPEGETGTASAINNAVARTAGLVAIASMGSLAAWVYAAGAGVETTFGLAPDVSPPSAGEAARQAATDQAFAAIAYVCAALTQLGAIWSWIALPRAASAPQERRG